MRMILTMLVLFGFLTGCEQAKDAGDETARELTGGNMVEQKKVIERQLQGIEAQQEKRLEQLNE